MCKSPDDAQEKIQTKTFKELFHILNVCQRVAAKKRFNAF